MAWILYIAGMAKAVNLELLGVRYRNVLVARGIKMLSNDVNRLVSRGNDIWRVMGFKPEVLVTVYKYRDCTVLEQHISDYPIIDGTGTLTILLPRYNQLFKDSYRRPSECKGMKAIQDWLGCLNYGTVIDRSKEVHGEYARFCRSVSGQSSG